MFGAWFYSKLRSAEQALREGRLDDAYRLAADRQLGVAGRADTLRADVARGLTVRARVRAQEARHREALDDLERARQLGHLDADGEALRARVLDELRDEHLYSEKQQDAVREAARHLEAGRLETGRGFVNQIEDRRQREQLREKLDARVNRAQALLEQAGEALRNGNVLAAVRVWCDAVTRYGRDRDSQEFGVRLSGQLRDLAMEQLRAGRLDRFCAAIEEGEALREIDPALTECAQIAEILRAAASSLGQRDFVRLREALLRLSATAGPGDWLRELLDTVGAVCAAQDRLLASPLAALQLLPRGGAVRPLADETKNTDRPPAEPRAMNRTEEDPAGEAAAVGSGRLLVLVDAAGSFLLAGGSTLRIGRAGGSARVDVPIPADIASHHADIVRAEDDYFLIAHGPAAINHRPVTRALLRDGDRVVLGTQGRFTFHKPSTKSSSATLRLAERCRLAQDVSQIVLFADTCMVGPQPSCHVQTRDNQTRLVLFERGGRLFARRVDTDGRHLDTADPIAMGRAQLVGDQRLTVTAYRAG